MTTDFTTLAKGALLGLGAVSMSLAMADAADAQERRVLGFALVSSNDDFLTREILDRWRSGALSLHLAHGTGWTGTEPIGFGQVLEFRYRGEIMTPEDIDSPDPDDRPYATSSGIGVHSHFRQSGTDFRVGADVIWTGEQTGLADLQKNLHDQQGLPDPTAAAENEIPNSTYFVVSGEAARSFPLGGTVAARPFVEGRVGDETFARIGVDLVGGSLNSGGLYVRDYATGQISELVRGNSTGFGWTIGADVASVADSVYLPSDRGIELEPMRGRARAGVMWAGERWSAFLGTSYLSEEFEGQSEGQVVGSFAFAYGF